MRIVLCANCLGIQEASRSWSSYAGACPGLHRDYFTFNLTFTIFSTRSLFLRRVNITQCAPPLMTFEAWIFMTPDIFVSMTYSRWAG